MCLFQGRRHDIGDLAAADVLTTRLFQQIPTFDLLGRVSQVRENGTSIP